MLFDTHAHYDDEAFDLDRDAVIADFGGLIVNPGCTVESSALAVEMASRHDKMYAAVGIHPENCGDFVHPLLGEVGVNSVHDSDLFVDDDIGVVSNAIGHNVLTFEQIYLMIVNADIFDIIGNKHTYPPEE